MSDPSPPDRDIADLRAFLAERDVACPGCGYNLRGQNAALCPECGCPLQLGVRTRVKVWFPAGAIVLLCSMNTLWSLYLWRFLNDPGGWRLLATFVPPIAIGIVALSIGLGVLRRNRMAMWWLAVATLLVSCLFSLVGWMLVLW